MKCAESGLTFVELMAALVILGLILAMIGGLYGRSVYMRNLAERKTSEARIGNTIISLIRRDLNAMAFFPGRRSVFFNLETDRDGMGNRRDTLSFDALVADRLDNGITVHRFGRITYYAEEAFGESDYRKLYRKTVFINDEYEFKAVGDDLEPDPDDTPRERARKEKERAKISGTDEDMTEAKLEKGEQICLLSNRVAYFGIDTVKNEEDEWDEIDVELKVPSVIRITISIAPKENEENAEDIELKEYSSVFIPVISPHVSNNYQKGIQKHDARDNRADKETLR